MLLLPAVVRRRVANGQIRYWFIESDPRVCFLFVQTHFFNCTPWQYCVAFTASICLRVHPRKLPACAEPRRASARRGETPLAHTINTRRGETPLAHTINTCILVAVFEWSIGLGE